VTTPTVSVCIPTYNGEQYVERTVRSVLAQTFTDFELVVRDDGSTDATLDVVQGIDDSRVRIVAGRENAGAGANFDLAVGEATGAYVKLLCQDDVIYPDCLERQVAAITATPDVVMVSCHRDIVDDHDRVVYRGRGWRSASGVLAGGRVMRATVRAGTNLVGEPSAVLCSREAFEAAGGFDTSYAYMIDLEAWMRLLEHGSLHYLPDSLCTFRVSRTSWSASLRREQARQARELLRTLRDRHPETVTRTDLAIGLTKPTLLAAARRAVFAASSVLPGRSEPVRAEPVRAADPVDPVDAS
jgi:glycosyltransferase involved in cell wall biosynthesis